MTTPNDTMNPEMNAICRLCIQPLTDGWWPFESGSKWRISSIMMACLGLEIFEGDSLPQQICHECRYQLARTWIFRKRSAHNNERLRKHVRLIANGKSSDMFSGDTNDFSDDDADEIKEYLRYVEEQDALKQAQAAQETKQHKQTLSKQMEKTLTQAKASLKAEIEQELRCRLQTDLRPIVEFELRLELEDKVRDALHKQFETECRNDKIAELLEEMQEFLSHKRDSLATATTSKKKDSNSLYLLNKLRPASEDPPANISQQVFIINDGQLEEPCSEPEHAACFDTGNEPDNTTSYEIRNEPGASIRVIEATEFMEEDELERPTPTHEDNDEDNISEYETFLEFKNSNEIEKESTRKPTVRRKLTAAENERRGNPNYRVNFTCSLCTATFCTRKLLERHMNTHKASDRRGLTHKCDVCKLQVSTRSALRRHMLLHTGARPHKCTECSKSFSQREVLRRHMFVHTGEKPYQCNHCEASFSQKNNLNSHIRRLHMAKPNEFACELCPKKFCHASGLSRHILSHEGASFKCGFCDREFKDYSSKKRHEKSQHPAAALPNTTAS